MVYWRYIKTKLAKLSVTSTFFLLLGLTFVVSVAISTNLVVPRVADSIVRMQESASQTEIALTADYLEQFVDSRVAVLRDIAQYPIVRNGVMGSGIARADLDDFLRNITILGNKEDLSLLNIVAEPVYSRSANNNHNYDASSLWFKRILSSQTEFEFNLLSYADNNYFQIAVPVKLDNFVEGILVSEIAVNLDHIFAPLFSSYERALNITKNDVTVYSEQRLSGQRPIVIEYAIPRLGVKMAYQVDAQLLENKKQTFIWSIVGSLLLSLGLTFVVLLISGRQVLLTPYRRLEQSEATLRIAKEAAENNAEKARLSELALKEQKFALDQHAIVAITDLGGTITYANKKFAEISGYSQKELLGKNHRILNSGYHERSFFKDLYATISQGDVWHGQICNKAKNGGIYWVDTTLIPFVDENGKPESYIAIRTDITENIHRQRALRETEAFQELILQSIPDYFFVKDSDFRIVQANQKFIELYSEEQRDTIIGSTTLEYYDEEERHQFLLEDKKAFDSGYSEVEESAIFPNGESRTMLTRKMRFENSSGEAFILCLARDITEHKRQQEALRESEERFQRAVKGSNDGLWDWDIASGDVFYAPRFRELLGYQGDDTDNFPNRRDTWEQSLHPEDKAATLKAIKMHFEENLAYDEEYRLRLKQGGYRYFRDKGNSIRDASGCPVRMAGAIIDISEQKRQQRELEKARAVAEQANQTKSEFLASMSHEIRTPMNGVLGMLGLLARSELSSVQTRQLTIAKASADSLLTIINDILDFSKIDAGKLILEELDFNLSAMLGDFAESMALRASEKQLELVLDLRKVPLVHVLGDPGRIRQILTNLVGNALKFTASGEIILRAELVERSFKGWWLRCSISDTGIGIAKDKQSELFDAFTQEDSSTTRKYGGTGLGLSICKKLCELMDGSIQVESEHGNGATFSFEVALGYSEKHSLVLPHVDLNGLNILVVDHNISSREVLAGQLSLWGASVIEAENSAQALKRLREHSERSPITVAIVDLALPDVGGEAFALEVRNDEQISSLNLVLMTSMGQSGDARKFAELGYQAYFPKPVTTDDLFKALSIVVDGGAALSQACPLVTRHYVHELADAEDDLTPEVRIRQDARILLVEDNTINQEVALGLLEDLGLDADIAANGLEAIHALQNMAEEKPYDLVLMDCQMPEMDGYEATRAVRLGRAGTENTGITIIAMTANAMTGDKEKCLAAGMDDYLSKPIDPEALDAALSRWIPASHQRYLTG